MGAVFAAHAASGDGGMGFATAFPDPEAVLVEGVLFLQRELQRASGWAHEQRMKRLDEERGAHDG